MNNYSKLAKIYDALYSFKNYEAEAKRLHEIISEKKTSPGNALLDVACGTGTHLSFLKKYYAVEGTDLTPEMLEVARARNPEITFHQGEMRSFDLGRRFDVVTCLFSSIGYMKIAARSARGDHQHGAASATGRRADHRAMADRANLAAGGIHAL